MSSYVVNGTLTLDQDALDALNGTSYKEIVTWGDSLTAGNEAGAGNQYPTILARDFGGQRTVINEGQGGATTTQVANAIIASPDMINDTVVIWAGRSNVTDPTQVLADMARIVSALGPNTHYVIMSIDNIDAPQEEKGQPLYNLIMGVNAQLAATYAGHYLDIRSILVNSYDKSSPIDTIDYQHDVVPTSLRVDDGHLNAAGNAIVAQNVHDFIVNNLDGPPPPRFTISGTGTITTAAATLDFTGFDTGNNTIVTTNAVGTTFTVDNLNTALHIVGGPGFDIIVDKTDMLTSSQQSAIFGQGIEEIVGSTQSWLAPGANPPPTITGIANDPGESSIDGVTDRRENTLLGTAFAGSTVSIYTTSVTGAQTFLGTALASQGGSWAYDYTAGSDGSFNIAATSTIAGLGQSAYSSIFPLIIDTVAPTQPSVTSVSLGNTSNTDGTIVSTAKFRGTAEASSTVDIYIDGSLVGDTRGRGTAGFVYYNGGLQLSPGPHTIAVLVVDAAGNASQVSSPYNFIVGSTGAISAAMPKISAAAVTPIVKATSAAGAIETFTGSVSDPIDGTSDPIVYTEQLADGTTETVHSGDTFAIGTHTIVASATDSEGNSGTAPPFTFRVVDPTEPVVTASATTPIVQTNSAAGGVETFTGSAIDPVDGTSDPIVYTEQLSNGTIAIVHSGDTFAIGTHTIVASATGKNNTIGTAPAFSFQVVDTGGPATPPAPMLTAASDTGRSSVDGTTADATPTFTGVTESGATVTLYDGTTTLGSVAAGSDGTWSITATPLADGVHSIRVKATDTAGLSSAFSLGRRLVVDTMAPAVPSFSLTTGSDSGVSATDGITRDTRPAFTGIAEAGATVTLLDGTTPVGTATASSSGSFTIIASTLVNGAHAMSVFATDAAGNVGLASGVVGVVVDTIAPAAPAAPTLTAASDTGRSSIDGITADTTPTFKGVAEAGATVTLYNSTIALGSVAAGADGSWSITAPFLANGTYILAVKATDVAGNISAFSKALRVVIDTIAPAAPSLILAATSDTGLSATDGITRDTTPTFTGTADAGATITLLDGTKAVGSTIASSSGAFFVTASALANGSHTLSAVATDAAGNVGAASAGVSVAIDTIAPATPAAPTLTAASDTGRSSVDGITADSTPTFKGVTEAGATVTLYSGTTVFGSVAAGADGSWAITTPSLADGTYFFTIKATDAAGNSSAFSRGKSVVVDTMPPAVSISSAGGAETNTLQLINGTSEYGSTVAVSDNGKVVGTAVVGSNGAWSDRVTLLEGANSVVASATDKAGNTGTSNAVDFQYAPATAAASSDLHTMIQAASSTSGSPGAQQSFHVTDLGHALITAAVDTGPLTNTGLNVAPEATHPTLAAASI